jgi:acetylornithine deacetylase/succinyl-diaminopimelate desuccinylase-like protein
MTDLTALLERVDAEALLDLARGMVRIPSQIPNEGPLAEFLAAEMERSGAFDEVLLQPVVPGRPNASGVVHGQGDGPNVVLNGHLDSLQPIGQWTRDPYRPDVEDGWLYGLSLTDMKAGVAALIEAARAIGRARAGLRGSVTVTAVMHHGIPGVGTKYFLDAWDRPIHAAINGEPTNLAIQIAHGGCWQFQLTTFGIPVHTSRREHGVDAIRKMMHVLDGLDESILTGDPDPAQRIPGLPRMVVGVIEAGPAPSRTAERCIARGDVRIPPGMTQQSLMQDFERYLGRLRAQDPQLRVAVSQVVHQRPYRIAADAPIVRTLAAAARQVTGHAPAISDRLPASAYVTDSPDFMRQGIPTVVYGPGDWNVEPDERIRIDDMVTAARVYALTAARIASGEAGAI